MSFGDNIKRLQQWHASLHHGGQLPGKKRDVLVGDSLSAAPGLFLDFWVGDALPTKRRDNNILAGRAYFALDDFPGPVLAFPREDMHLHVLVIFRACGGGSHSYSLIKPSPRQEPQRPCKQSKHLTHSLVQDSISSSDVNPAFTLRNPD